MYLTFTIILLLLGVALLFAEMFVLPGFGVAGVFGFLSLAGSVAIAYWKLNIL
jgi:membrane-bound ClpP family serine protease